MISNDSGRENKVWEDSLTGKVAYYMLTNGFSPILEERKLKFTRFLRKTKHSYNLKHLLKRVNELQKLADGFEKAKVEYLKIFSPNQDS